MQTQNIQSKTHSLLKFPLSRAVPVSKTEPLGNKGISYSAKGTSRKEELKQAHKKNRYRTQSIIQKLLSQCAGKWLITGCGKKRVLKESPVGVLYNPKHGSTSFTNVQSCGLKWLCPVCLEREAQEQRKFVQELIIFMQKHGYYAHMLTFTTRHKKFDKLDDLIKGMKAARKRFFGDRSNLKFFKESMDYVGHITALEIKYSNKNGWHPHFHTVLFTKQPYSEAELYGKNENPVVSWNEKTEKFESDNALGLAQKLSLMWMNACNAVGLKAPTLKHGLDVKRGYDDSETQNSEALVNYALKAAMACEISLSQAKTGRFNLQSLTPFELALLSEDEGSFEDDDSRYSHLFYEYACATKGKAMIEPSRALKKLLRENGFYQQPEPKKEDDVPNVLDPDAQKPELEPEPFVIFQFSDFQWRALCASHERRGEFLNLIDKDIKEHGVEDRYFPRASEFLTSLLTGWA